MRLTGCQGVARAVARVVLFTIIGLASTASHAQTPATVGRPIVELLREAASQGIHIVFSDRLVPPTLRAAEAPRSSEPIEALREVLRAHALVLEEIDSGVYVIKRVPRSKPTVRAKPLIPEPSAVEEVQVAASRYAIGMAGLNDAFALNTIDLETQPGLSNDAARAVRRFPGTAGIDASSRTYVRGGVPSENLILLDGVPLFEPFHLKRLPIAYSMIDPVVLDGAELFSGVFPVEHDGYMSSLMSLQLRKAEEIFGGRLALSGQDASVLLSGHLGADERNEAMVFTRTALDLINQSITDVGGADTSAEDTLARVRLHRDDGSQWTLGLLETTDEVFFSLRNDFTADASKHRYAWVAREKRWNSIRSRTLFAHTQLRLKRSGLTSFSTSGSTGSILDHRGADLTHLRQDWTMPLHGGALRWGLSGRNDRARITYTRDADFVSEADKLFPRHLAETARVAKTVRGRDRQAYVGWSGPLGARFAADGGVHFVYSNFSTDASAAAWNPRLSVLYHTSDTTRWRLSWGRMSQTPAAVDLPVEQDRLFFGERSSNTMSVLALEHELSRNTALRAEVFHKRIEDPQPRLENVFHPDAFLPELRADAYIIAPESAEAYGFDLYLQSRLSDRISGWLTYSYSHTTDEIGGRAVVRSWDQPHSLSLGAAFEGGAWLFSGAVSAHSAWPMTPLIYTADRESIGDRNSLRQGYYLTLDLRASHRVPLSGSTLRFAVDISNATDRKNRCCNEAYYFQQIADDSTNLAQEPRFWRRLLPYASISWEF
jgi:hypothetical protein